MVLPKGVGTDRNNTVISVNPSKSNKCDGWLNIVDSISNLF